jgi:hypothetical protein
LVGLILAIAFLIATIVLFFVMKIPKALGVVTGRTEKKAIEEIRAGSFAGRNKEAGSGRRIHVRDVEMDTGALHKTGSLGATGEMPQTAGQNAMRDAAAAQAAQAAQATAQAAATYPSGGGSRSRKDRSKAMEETEILEFTGNLDSPELTPESEGETDVLSDDAPGATDATIRAKAVQAVYQDEETDVLSSGPRTMEPEEDGETDVLISGTSVPEDEEIVGRYSAEETAVLRSIHSTAEESGASTKEIRVIYSETILHTNESL